MRTGWAGKLRTGMEPGLVEKVGRAGGGAGAFESRELDYREPGQQRGRDRARERNV